MRREPWFAVGLILSAIAEIQWAATFYASDETWNAVALFAAACGLFLAGAGVFFKQDAWTWQLGLAVAAAAHLAYAGLTLSYGPWLILAALAATAGLGVAAWGTRAPGNVDLVRYGLFGAALGAFIWILSDASLGDMSFMVGNVFAMFGWGIAAAFVPDKVA